MSRKLLKAFQGDLRVLIEAVPLCTRDFLGNFADKWAELGRLLGQRKQRLWSELPDSEFGQLFTPVQRATDAESLCQVCYGAWDRSQGGIIDDGIRKCRRCHGFEKLGTAIRDAHVLVIEQVDPIDPPENADWRQVLHAFGWKVQIGEGTAQTAIRVAFTSDFLPPWLQHGWSYEFRPLASVVPPPVQGERRLPDYDEIAQNATGAKWLGVLRMDVDSLGVLFAQGLGENATLSRMATLSRTMRYFFEGYVAHLCEPYAQRSQLYLIYAGGDDLFVVGAWSVLPELALEIRKAFRQLVSADHITLSGGIAISHSSAPLYQLAETARYALDEQAKAHRWRHNGTEREKDALSFLQTPMGWGEFERVYAMFQQV
ncbi:MAG: type III-A CRISPR-associated protein Cas10/Csm1, partial [Fimbriimonadales bacterium]|nr:type III-A CRISPR-associated protein Cas10/Csm1 [Fimbriimonadales bacterium]